MPPARRPQIVVLAGVNGAGKSSVGGQALADSNLTWFNPDTYARELVCELGMDQEEANGLAWEKGRSDLQAAIEQGRNYAFETTLGGTTITRMLLQACDTHDVVVWYCGLDSLQKHLERVQLRHAAGGHHIAREKIEQRWTDSPLNLIRLMPRLASLAVYDNSASVAAGEVMPDPVLVLRVNGHRVVHPDVKDAASMAATPLWARPLVAHALDLQEALGRRAAPRAAQASARRSKQARKSGS